MHVYVSIHTYIQMYVHVHLQCHANSVLVFVHKVKFLCTVRCVRKTANECFSVQLWAVIVNDSGPCFHAGVRKWGEMLLLCASTSLTGRGCYQCLAVDQQMREQLATNTFIHTQHCPLVMVSQLAQPCILSYAIPICHLRICTTKRNTFKLCMTLCICVYLRTYTRTLQCTGWGHLTINTFIIFIITMSVSYCACVQFTVCDIGWL